MENCFRHAGFSTEGKITESEITTRGVAEEDKDLGSLLGRLKDVVTVEATLDAFISVDGDVPTTASNRSLLTSEMESQMTKLKRRLSPPLQQKPGQRF